MGGFASGLLAAGLSLQWATDSDQHAAATFRHRFPEVEFLDRDICDLRATSLEPVDVLAGGFPCQSFSQAGKRAGFEDERGRLFFEIPRLIGEWAESARPKLMILENVPYLLYGADGAWFGEIQKSLRRAGYWFREESCWTANVRDWTGLPQDRERLFLVAASRTHFTYNPFTSPPTPDNAIKSQSIHDVINRAVRSDDIDYLPPGNTYRKMIEAEMAVGQSPANLYQVRRNYVREKPGALCPTLTANMGIGGHNVPFLRDEWGIRRLRVREVARLQGFSGPEEQLFPSEVHTAERYRLLGNAACPELARLAGEQCLEALKEIAP